MTRENVTVVPFWRRTVTTEAPVIGPEVSALYPAATTALREAMEHLAVARAHLAAVKRIQGWRHG